MRNLQIAIIGNEVSEELPTKYGAPQGSVIGPPLFSVYINDIVKNLRSDCTIALFADDMIMYTIGKSSEKIE